MRLGPVALSAVAFAISKQKGTQTLLSLTLKMLHVLPRSGQVAQPFLRIVGNPHCSQFSGSMQARQHKTIAAVSLDPFACFPWNQRRCDNLAIPAEIAELPMDPVSARACLIAKREMRVSYGNLPNIANLTSVRIGY